MYRGKGPNDRKSKAASQRSSDHEGCRQGASNAHVLLGKPCEGEKSGCLRRKGLPRGGGGINWTLGGGVESRTSTAPGSEKRKGGQSIVGRDSKSIGATGNGANVPRTKKKNTGTGISDRLEKTREHTTAWGTRQQRTWKGQIPGGKYPRQVRCQRGKKLNQLTIVVMRRKNRVED